MWTVEEDLFILQLVEQHGKRWSKIAAHLPGRTDNGVRNRWNRMERAQLIKKNRGVSAGYRCRRCGEPKRGHICAARMMLNETPEGDDLHMKAVALTEISAAALKTAVEQTAEREQLAQPQQPKLQSKLPAYRAPAQPWPAHAAHVSPELLVASWAADTAAFAAGSFAEVSARAPQVLTQPPLFPTTAAAAPLPAAHAVDAVEHLDLFGHGASGNVNDFLEQLRMALDDDSAPPATAPPRAAPQPPHAPVSSSAMLPPPLASAVAQPMPGATIAF